MPVTVRKIPVKGGKDFAIVEVATGKIKGRSSTKAQAQRSANVRNAVKHGFKPTGKPARR
ncbi:hypothetical protein LCGC14_0420790 [marine sediment metagenome]|uniref:Uncharacterized protein n=1 Tax=marine sediment metagenome TaxID=412755 RepID=A0A0F9SR64_9ZZZZ